MVVSVILSLWFNTKPITLSYSLPKIATLFVAVTRLNNLESKQTSIGISCPKLSTIYLLILLIGNVRIVACVAALSWRLCYVQKAGYAPQHWRWTLLSDSPCRAWIRSIRKYYHCTETNVNTLSKYLHVWPYGAWFDYSLNSGKHPHRVKYGHVAAYLSSIRAYHPILCGSFPSVKYLHHACVHQIHSVAISRAPARYRHQYWRVATPGTSSGITARQSRSPLLRCHSDF